MHFQLFVDTKLNRRLVLHFGPPKTGSKAIQRGFFAHREALKALGIIYPNGIWQGQLASWAQLSDPNCTFNVWAKRRNLDENRDTDRAYVAELLSQLTENSSNTALISYEGFSVLNNEELERILELMSPSFSRIDVLIYLRHPISWVTSELSTQTLHGVVTNTPRDLIRRYSSIISRAFSIFGRDSVIVREFDRNSLFKGDVFLDALSVCDRDVAENFVADSSGEIPDNPSLSLQAYQVATHLSRELSQSANREQKKRFEAFLHNLHGDKLGLSQAEVDEVQQVLDAEITFLRRELAFEFSNVPEVTIRGPNSGFRDSESESIANALRAVISHE